MAQHTQRPATLDIDAALFDLDGTLVDTLDMILASMRYTTEQVFGKALPDDVLMRNVGVPLIVQMREWDEERADEMLHIYREHNARVHDELIREFPGIDAGLRTLAQRGLPMAIVTSKSRPVAQRAIDLFDLGLYTSLLVAMEDTELHKPRPEPLLLAAARLGVAIERCAYVGDSPHDMAAAVAAGAVAVGVTWGVASRERLAEAGAAHIADSMDEVVALLGIGA